MAAAFPYKRSPDQSAAAPAHHKALIIGAGPVGLTLALDLAKRGIAAVLCDDSDCIGEGSRAICFAKKTLEIWDRLGCAAPMLEKGVEWNLGKVFQGNELLYSFNLLPEAGHKMPAFINLQQYYAEQFLAERALREPLIDLRWRSRITGLAPAPDHARVAIETPDGAYTVTADWVIACDGARSPARGMLGLAFEGERFEDQFLIADIKMRGDYPAERWFWFDPPFHQGQSALLHKQPDDIWRIDLQLGAGADAEHEKRPEIVRPRIERMLGHGNFELEWISVYRFQCKRLEKLTHGRVIFAGDSAHQVSPFGARGANSGVQDADNLGWKLALVLKGEAPAALIASYDAERGQAADENIAHSTRSTDFIAPRSAPERILRDAALSLARENDFAKRLVNPGRLSTATAYSGSPLSTADAEVWTGGPPPGAALPDAPAAGAFLSEALPPGFCLMSHGAAHAPPGLPALDAARLIKPELLTSRFGLEPGNAILIRPDSHVAARFKCPQPEIIAAALARAKGLTA